MNCPMCQMELEPYFDDELSYYENVKCKTQICFLENTPHYCKYIRGNSTHIDNIEDISIYPFLIRNTSAYYPADSRLGKYEVELIPAHTVTSCFVFKYNPDKYKHYNKEAAGGFNQVLSLRDHIKVDIEEKLRDRLKLLLLLS